MALMVNEGKVTYLHKGRPGAKARLYRQHVCSHLLTLQHQHDERMESQETPLEREGNMQ